MLFYLSRHLIMKDILNGISLIMVTRNLRHNHISLLNSLKLLMKHSNGIMLIIIWLHNSLSIQEVIIIILVGMVEQDQSNSTLVRELIELEKITIILKISSNIKQGQIHYSSPRIRKIQLSLKISYQIIRQVKIPQLQKKEQIQSKILLMNMDLVYGLDS